MDPTRLLYTDTGSIIISIILGVGLAALFRKACNDNKCIIIKGPSYKEVDKYYYKVNDVCYKYRPVFQECRD